MAPTRRNFIKGVGAFTVGSTLMACSDVHDDTQLEPTDPSVPDNPLPSADFDFPIVTPLPFAHGVASGDPLADRVIIWTRITDEIPAGPVTVYWQVATDPSMDTVVVSGEQQAVEQRDWTIKVDVTGLLPATSYYYQFRTVEGWTSIVGRTRTAPRDDVDELRLAVLACSSYWSSHWSGLGHLADRDDLDLVVHCGDYIYDFVDNDERVRARKDIEDISYVDYRDWLNIDECRRRYALYRSDPNLLRAHQQHPWSIVWDNHDISVGFGNELDDSAVDASMEATVLADVVQAFHEWTPTRPLRADGSGEFIFVDDGSYPVPADPLLIYRKLDYGPMADIYCVDTQLHMPSNDRPEVVTDSSHLASGDSLFSRPQYQWLTDSMLASQQEGKRWRLLVNQSWMSNDVERWGEHPQERDQLFAFWAGNNDAALAISNNIVLSGDMHGNLAADLIVSDASYASGDVTANTRNGSTEDNVAAGWLRDSTANTHVTNARAASVGVEFAPSSMGRGGADETIAGALPDAPFSQQVAVARGVEKSLMSDSNLQFMEWVDHGYGIVHMTAEAATFEFWWQDKQTQAAPDVLGCQMISFASDDPASATPRYRNQIDAVGLHGIDVVATVGSRVADPAPNAELKPA